MLGFGARSQTPANIQRTGECVLNLPSVHEAAAVNGLARTTASNPVPPHKLAMGYRHEPDKLALGGFTRLPSHDVSPPRFAECPVHWRPLIMSFQQFYGLSDRVQTSTLAEIPEEAYRPRGPVLPNATQAA